MFFFKVSILVLLDVCKEHSTKFIPKIPRSVSILVLLDVCKEQNNPAAVPTPSI